MRRQTTTGPQGFTLIELMIAIAVASLFFLGVFGIIRAGINTQIFVREMSDAGRQGPAILQQIADDLENCYFYNLLENDAFIGKNINNGDYRADRIHFLTTRPSLLSDSRIEVPDDDLIGQPAPITEVSWLLKPNENDERFWELHRREQPGVDDEINRGGYYRMVSDRIISFKVQYTGWDLTGGGLASTFGAAGGENGNAATGGETAGTAGESGNAEDEEDATLTWEDEWDSVERGGLPVAVRIEMVISPDMDPQVMERLRKTGRDDELDHHYVQIILLPQFREDVNAMKTTYAWDGTVAEPFSTGGAAGGAGRGSRGRGSDGGTDGRGGNNPGGGNNNNPGAGSTTNSPFLDAIRGGNKNGAGGNIGNILGGGSKR
ncbi:MAG: prepilin-type N-terminal cleavage/methylation domain-containing protein [Planctomycetes bacterium]|nr:prepilin-type N-terminal cleavage/methylation domain-containing protein [Planctomycetota bacterium]